MGKRSDFARKPRDFYPTPREAVVPLVRHLPRSFRYMEPCAGDGRLVQHLDILTHDGWCLWESDIEPFIDRADSLNAMDIVPNDTINIDYIITNPPWDRKSLHPMIEHFSAMKPTWLLFDADWMHTKQSAPFMPYLHKVVSVGWVKWIPDSKMTGKDNCAWYLFDQSRHAQTQFFGRVAA